MEFVDGGPPQSKVVKFVCSAQERKSQTCKDLAGGYFV